LKTYLESPASGRLVISWGNRRAGVDAEIGRPNDVAIEPLFERGGVDEIGVSIGVGESRGVGK
jgi:hypothetical protein